ncbi:ferredoxin-NADP reductase/predicted pyridoxine 5'-phosphate oxidase superfamily flavin-nucleotide-binding protein [Rhizobium tibeticum]|uniref:2Fe-2S iron-sulfur cluster-binding protein n=1 Tax=Rhizobium tibeticum TaxID=501024 RepID=UPI00277D8ECC|nr:pyridoxamine 5'-phosphate oxidase family protein [Rhizobium tibeticum]MDP9809298.1 ferredoxin-NADP reductase/predicted pyridoxine 5'-phosphate oxidase superfamily flavin-nucleotide-binding protein [Rhizobium tibeticum]
MPIAAQSTKSSPWHAGEIALHEKVGVAKRMDEVGRRVLRDHLIDQHRQFYAQLPFIVLGTADADGNAWATLRANRPGFLESPDIHTLSVRLPREHLDPADAGIDDGKAIAMLGIELHTRRRNRLNGTVHRTEQDGFDVRVGQSYGNCPQYIQLRDFDFVRDPMQRSGYDPVHFDSLDGRPAEMIAKADTLFVASYVDREDGERQIDVSHRGGRPGFVRIGEDGVLTIPDFAGNLFFNTLGNILANPRAGLVFADFENGDLLQLTGDAQVILESPEIAAFQGAERLWRFRPTQIVYRQEASPLRWRSRTDGPSPNSLMTGSWNEAAARLRATAVAKSWRPFRVARIVQESASVRSFYLEPTDAGGIIPHVSGQHLPVRIDVEGSEVPAVRTYTISSAPSDGTYRISVKREGLVSTRLHDAIREGDIIEARAPAGAFTINATERRPAVLLAAGIGITPLLAMLRHVVYEGLRTRRIRPTWLVYSAHSKSERAFDTELQALAAASGGVVRLVRLLSDTSDTVAGEDYEQQGRVDMNLLSTVLPFNDYDFYLCGPVGFMQSVHDGLRGLNIADNRIHAEAFGSASLQRSGDEAKRPPARAAARDPQPVNFMRSGKQARWEPGSGSLLELAGACGLAPDFNCRLGNCGSCRTKIVSGAVAYVKEPTADAADDEALICCAVPAASDTGARLELDI